MSRYPAVHQPPMRAGGRKNLPEIDQSEAEFDPDNPEGLLGVRISVEWAGKRFYEGTVNDYDAKTNMHHVLYDDNDKRWYVIAEKTFYILGTGELHQGQITTGQPEVYEEFRTYIPKDPNSRTRCTFQVLVDASLVDTAAGDQITVHGSLPQLGAWGPHGVPLRINPDNPAIWFGQIELPFALNESFPKGIFEYKFAIERGGDVALEGGRNRRPNRCQLNYYGSMIKDVRNQRYKGWKKPKLKLSISTFTKMAFNELLTGAITASGFISRFHDVSKCYSGTRIMAEAIVDSLLTQIPEEPQSRAVATMCLVAVVGSFGLTSHDKPKGGTQYSSYSYNQPKAPPLPPPRDWCHFVLKNLPMQQAFALHLRNDLGPLYMRCVTGLRECAERVGATGSFRWLMLVPILQEHKQLPHISVEGKQSAKDKAAAFAEISGELTALADSLQDAQKAWEIEQKEEEERLKKEAEEAAEAKGDEKDDGKKEQDEKEDKAKRSPGALAHAWLRALVRYAPTVHALGDLFAQAGFRDSAFHLLGDVADRLRSFYWSKPNEIQLLGKLVSGVDGLQAPELASAMLLNPTIDNDHKLNDPLLQFVGLCVSGLDEKAGALSEGPLFECLSAAKEYIRRRHQHEIVEKDDKKEWNTGWFGGGGYQDKKKQPTPKELAKKRLNALTLACNDVNAIICIGFFGARAKDLLFVLSRCHFMKGSPDAVLASIAALGRTSKGFSVYSPHLGDFLVSQGVRILEEVVPTYAASAPGELVHLLNLINKELPAEAAARHTLIFHLARAAGGAPPTLTSIFTRAEMWIQIFRSCGRTPAQWTADTPLNGLLKNVFRLLTETANRVIDSTVVLHTLHAVLKAEDAFLALLKVTDFGMLTVESLRARAASLRSFDGTLAEVQCYVNFFCSCGVRIDVEAMRKTVADLTQRYDSLELQQVHGAFTALLQPYGGSIAWLFRLQNSALFLDIWREEGKKLTDMGFKSALEADEKKAAESGVMETKMKHVAALEAQIKRMQDQAAAGGGDEEKMQARVRALGELLLKLRSEVHDYEQQQQQAASIQVKVEVTLDQSRVIKELLPAAKTKWKELMMAVRSGGIAINDLQATFGTLAKTDEECLSELRVLAATGSGQLDEAYDPRWIAEAAGKMKDFMLLTRLRKWLPALLKIRELVAELLTCEQKDDPFYAKLASMLEVQEKQWDSQTLNTVSALVEPVKKELAETFTATQLNFLALMAENERLLQWLLEHKSTGEFNQLLQVCRPNTDEPRILSSIASLVQIRTLLLQPLYSKPPFPSFSEFLVSFRDDVGVTEDAINHLDNIQASFDGLIEVFEKNTRSPGIKSCYEVRDISLYGEFVFQACADETQVLFLEMKRPEPATTQDVADGKADAPDAKASPAAAADGKMGDAAPEVKGASADESDSGVRREPLEYLLDLRSKLMMTEIPEELEDELQINAMVDSFVVQLQYLTDIRDEVFALYSSGHFDYQESYRLRLTFKVDGLPKLASVLDHLRDESRKWGNVVRKMRETHYFLNYFTMREILRLTALLSEAALTVSGDNIEIKPLEPEELARQASGSSEGAAGSKAAKATLWACPACTLENAISMAACQVCGGARPEEYTPQLQSAGGGFGGHGQVVALEHDGPLNPVEEFTSLLHLVSSAVDEASVRKSMELWKDVEEQQREEKQRAMKAQAAAESGSPDSLAPPKLVTTKSQAREADVGFLLNALGEVLSSVFGGPGASETAGVARRFSTLKTPLPDDDDKKSESKAKLADEKYGTGPPDAPRESKSMASPGLEPAIKSSPSKRRTAGHGKAPACRAIPPPGPTARNRADMLISIAETESSSLPIWVSCAEGGETRVIDVVLSVYVRRARLPEPGEIVFCTPSTRLEDIELLFWRFIKARQHGRADCVFCCADVHALSYTLQTAVVERLREMLQDYGTDEAASLLFVSGKPRQVVLNSLSEQSVELPPLDDESLRQACSRAFHMHTGETISVSSSINGGGKTHHIMKMIGERQKMGEPLLYRRVPFRESSSAASLVTVLNRVSNKGAVGGTMTDRNAFHIDIGHIIPANANTVLFELLVVGVLKNTTNCRTYWRKSNDIFVLEIPNSRGEKTAKALRFCSLLPTTRLAMGPEVLELRRPIFTNKYNTRISAPEYTEMVFVCKYLRAFEAGKLRAGSDTFDPEYNPWLDEDISAEDCYRLMSSYTSPDGFPSFLIFHSFLSMMYAGFMGIQQYAVFSGAILANTQGLESLKHVFTNLLIETSKDFSLRAVPRGKQFGGRRIVQLPASLEPTAEPRGYEMGGFGFGDAGTGAAAAAIRDRLRILQGGLPGAGDGGADIADLDVAPVPAPPAEDVLAAAEPEPAPVPPTRPGLVRAPSSTRRVELAQALAPPPLERELSDDMAQRFEAMTTWEDTEHPVVLFYTSERGQEVEGMDILSLNPQYVDSYMRHDMKAALKENRIDMEKDWRELRSEQGMQILRKVEGFGLFQHGHSLEVEPVQSGYVITIDNLLKMLSIQLRMKNNLPVVIMGETGCGKSSLIRQLCAVINSPLRTLNIHGGMEDEDIIGWMNGCIQEALLYPKERIVVFLDEVNTCNSMGLFKEMVCDRSMNGSVLPPNIKLIAACNPYRLKKGKGFQEERMAGLIFDHHAQSHSNMENVGTGITDPLKDLVYRVHPLPESMIDHVFDFGALSPDTERLYIKAMLRRQLAIYVADEKEEVEEPAPKAPRKTKDGRILTGNEVPCRYGDECTTDGCTFLHPKDIAQDEDPTVVAAAAAGAITSPDIPAALLAVDDPSLMQDAAMQAQLQEALLKKAASQKLTDFGEFVEVFAELICAAQEFVRKVHGGERSVVSLRDVARCVKVFRWFGEHFSKGATEHIQWTLEEFFAVKKPARNHVRQAVILSLAFCYHARLPRDERQDFCKSLEECWRELQKPITTNAEGGGQKKGGDRRGGRGRGRRRSAARDQPRRRAADGRNIDAAYGDPSPGLFGGLFGLFQGPQYGPRCTWMNLDAVSFERVLRHVQRSFVKNVNVGEGIALNEALLENLFMILVSVLNKIPIFVVGKPGSSKSLAMGLIQSNLNGEASDNPFLRSLPAVEVFSYQCSPLSTSAGIESAFEAADRYAQEADNTIVVVLLDEVGLAEQSPHLPLKVLHKVLDEKGGEQAVVGISNWALDPAKMNRAVHLYRPAPTVEDLSVTAENMVQQANLKGYLQALARAYSEVYANQVQPDFWGLREFYSTVRHINRALTESKRPLSSDIIMNAVLRNYGGRPQEINSVLQVFFQQLGMTMDRVPREGVVDLVKQNLTSTEARHLMLLTKNNAALGLLFDNSILAHDRTEVIFGSDFPLDKTDLQICLNIQRVKLCMAEGITVVLVHCEALYESLYDLLNQHYTEYGGRLYVRLAFGTHSRLCPMAKGFRVVVVVEKYDAYNKLAPPLLNRFEKQVMERQHLLLAEDTQLLARLRAFATVFAADAAVVSAGTAGAVARTTADQALDDDDPDRDQVNKRALREAFCGYHSGTLSSLAQSVRKVGTDLETRFTEAVKRLMWTAVPEAVCRVMGSARNKQMQEEFQIDAPEVYFKEQHHDDLSGFANQMLDQWTDGVGAQVVCMTFAPLTYRVKDVMKKQTKWKQVDVVVLHQLSSARDMVQEVDDFFESAQDGSVLVVQCDPLAASLRRIEHAKYICENARAKFQAARLKASQPERKAEAKTSEAKGAPGLQDDEDSKRRSEGKSDEKGHQRRESKVAGDDSKGSPADAREPQAGPSGVHVVLLIHLPRSEMKYVFDFDLRWRYSFIDSTEPARATGLPDIQGMLGHSFQDIFNGLDLRLMLLRNFRAAMTRLVYLHQRTNEDVRNQIVHLLDLLENHQDNSFVTAVKSAIVGMLAESEHVLDIMETARQSDELALAGTFQAALHRKITATVSDFFAVVLGHLDRNSGLFLVGPQQQALQPVWHYLFLRSMRDMGVFQRQTQASHVEVPADGRGGLPFQAQFPFSFYISRLLESMRNAAENTQGNLEEALQQQFSLVRLAEGLSGPLQEGMLKRYTQDFTAMHAMVGQTMVTDSKTKEETQALDTATQATIVWRALCLFGGATPELISAIHARYWQVERRLHAYFELIDAVPQSKSAIVDLIVGETNLDTFTDLKVIQIVLGCLNPQQQNWKLADEYARWLPRVDQARATIDALLEGIDAGEKPGSTVRVSGVTETGGSTPAPTSEGKSAADGKAPASDAKGASAEDGKGAAPVQAQHGDDASQLVVSLQVVDRPVPRDVPPADLEGIHTAWEKLLFNYTFIRDVSSRLLIDPQLTLETLAGIADIPLRTQKTFRVLIRMLSDLNRQFSRMGQEVECEICCCIPENPVRSCSECRRLVCRSCIESFMATQRFKESRACFHCRRTGVNFIVTEHKDERLVELSRGKEEQLRMVARRFMEFYIINFCFEPTTAASQKLEHALLHDFIRLLSKRPLEGTSEKYFIDVLPPGAGRVSLMRSLLTLPDKSAHAFVVQRVLQELEETVKEQRYLDTPLSVCFASVQEEFMMSKIATVQAAVEAARKLNLDHIRYVPGKTRSTLPIHLVLRSVAQARRVLEVFAEGVIHLLEGDGKSAQDSKSEQKAAPDTPKTGGFFGFFSRAQPATGSSEAQNSPLRNALNELQDLVMPLLRTERKTGPPDFVRSCRMFLLKNLERHKGISFVRNALTQPPFKDGAWLAEWKQSGDTGLIRFMGDNKLPRHNPLVSLPLWQEINRGVSNALSHTGSTTPLEGLVRTLSADPANQPRVKAALLACVFHEAFLMRVLPEIPAVTQRKFTELQRWVARTSVLSFMSRCERELLAYFANKQPAEKNPALEFLTLTPESTTEHIALVRVVMHLAIAALSQAKPPTGGVHGGGLLSFFATVITSPSAIKGTFLPGMIEDVTAMAVRVLGGRWYKCPNGHAYYVDKCGRPTVVQKCSTCGVDIGGTDHNPLPGQADLDPKLEGNTEYSQKSAVEDKSEPNYCLRQAEEEKNPFDTVRGLPPSANRVQRFLLHAALCAGALVGGRTWLRAAVGMLNRQYCTTANPIEHFTEHLRSDWNVLRGMMRRSGDDTAMLLHEVLVRLTEEPEEALPLFKTGSERSDYETVLAKHTVPILDQDGLAERLEAVYKRFSSAEDDEAGVFVAELQERFDVGTMDVVERALTAPALWRYRKPFSLQDFRMDLNLRTDVAAEYPLLNYFLVEEEKLRALRHLPAVIEWTVLLLNRYNRRIDHVTASSTTVANVLETAPDQQRWRSAWDGYKSCWNDCWRFVERFGCMTIPAVYRNMTIDESTPITFCLPCEKDEGICPLSLCRFAGQQHNNFVERIDELLLMRGEELQRSSARNAVVSSKFFTNAHALNYDFGQFLGYLEKQCVQYSASGNVVYDFGNAEQYLLDSFFKGKPLVDLEVRMFQFTDESGGYAAALLKQKVKQENLPKDVAATILKELGSPSRARQTLDLLETVISFLQATGGSFVQRLDVGDTPLGEYVKNFLLMKEAEFGSRTIAQQVRLKHIDFLYQLLRDFTVVDPFANVRSKYKEPLDEKTADRLATVCDKLEKETLLPLMKEFITGQLTEEHMSANIPIKMTVGALEHNDNYLADLTWFDQFFPDDLPLRNVLSVYKVIEAQNIA